MTSQIKTTPPQIKAIPLGSKFQSKAKKAWYGWAIFQIFIKLDPRQQVRNPVIFLVEMGALLTTVFFIEALLRGSNELPLFNGMVAAWLWITVLLANLAEAIVEGPTRFRTEVWHQRCRNIPAKKLDNIGRRKNYNLIPTANLHKGDLIFVESGDTVPVDGEIVEGTALIDEGILFGQDTPIVREVGRDHPAVASGTRVLSDWLVVRASANPNASLLPHLATLLDESKRREFPHTTLLKLLLAGSILMVLLFVNVVWNFFLDQAAEPRTSINIVTPVALLLSLMPVTSSGLWRPVNLVEIAHLIRENVIPLSTRAMKTAEKVDVLLLDQCAVVDPDRNLKKRLAQLRRMGVKTVLTAVDSAYAAAALAAEAGMDDFLAHATPTARLELIRDYQARGYRVAVAGSSTNEATCMLQADLAVGINSSAQAVREAAGMIDLNSQPAKLVKIVEISRQWLVTRRVVTLFTLANDTAKFFILIPAVFVSIFPGLATMSVMHLTTATSVILAAIIFNALSIIFLTLLIRREISRSNLNTGCSILINFPSVVYAVGGLIAPFIGIKVIDLILMGLGFV